MIKTTMPNESLPIDLSKVPTDAAISSVVPDLPFLIVDDDPKILHALDRTLSSQGWRVLAAKDGPEALALLAANEVAVIISDFRMPGMDGVELLRRARDLQPGSERILLTAYAELEALERGVNEARIHQVLNKPCPTATLIEIAHDSAHRNRIRREHEVLIERLKNRNAELSYVNGLLVNLKATSDRDLVLFRRRWDAALNAISDPIIIVSATLRLEGANAAAAGLAGQPAAALEGQLCYAALFKRQLPCDGCPLGTGSGRVHRDLDLRRRLLDAHAYLLPGGSPAYLCVYRDVTDEIELGEQAAQIEKLAAIGRLAGGVAHEINNPLQAILSFSQLAQTPETTPTSLQRALEIIHESGVRCRDIVQALRTFSRREPLGEKARVDLRPLAEKVLVLFRSNKKVKIEIAPDSAPTAPVSGNANQLQQVIVNLLQNAIDASPTGESVRLGIAVGDGRAVLTVDDQGPGVAAADRDKIFEPFFTTKPEGQGTGLGLSISQQIVQEHGGELRVGSSPGGGARFAVVLPLALQAGEGES